MGSVNLGIGRIVVIVALVVAGVALLANGFSTDVAQPAASPSVTLRPHLTPSPTPATSVSTGPTNLPSPAAPADITFAVFNGTSAAGLAGTADSTLTAAGYVSGQTPANSPVTPVSNTTVYFRGGADADQNESDAQRVANTLYKNAKIALLGPDFSTSVGKSVQVVVVLGQDYAAANAGG
jgi:LytR cell envelope-related transcriptional attenuator